MFATGEMEQIFSSPRPWVSVTGQNMLSRIRAKESLAEPFATARGSSVGVLEGSALKCRQCSEHFSRRTRICPRCGCVNDSGYLLLFAKVLVLAIFIGTAAWAVWSVKHADRGHSSEMLKPLPKFESGSGGQPDVRF
jgi:hypothetical protein